MPTIYETDDGRTFSSKSQAQGHANWLAGPQITGSDINKRKLYEDYNKIVGYFNTGDWNAVINGFEASRHSSYSNYCHFGTYIDGAELLEMIAYIKRDGDYTRLFDSFGWNWHYTKGSHDSSGHKNVEKYKLYDIALEAAKEAWQKEKGKPLTDADIAKLNNDYNRKKNSSSSSSASGSTPLIIKIIGAGVGAVVGGMLLGIIGVIGGAIGGWFLGQFLGKKFFTVAIILGVLGGGLYVGRNIIGSVISNVTKSNTNAQTAAVTADSLNMRASPSASGDIVKTLSRGDTLIITGSTENGWTPVTHGGDSGYVSAQYISN